MTCTHSGDKAADLVNGAGEVLASICTLCADKYVGPYTVQRKLFPMPAIITAALRVGGRRSMSALRSRLECLLTLRKEAPLTLADIDRLIAEVQRDLRANPSPSLIRDVKRRSKLTA